MSYSELLKKKSKSSYGTIKEHKDPILGSKNIAGVVTISNLKLYCITKW